MKQFLIALDQLANTLAGGYADETLSARAHRVAEEGGPAWPQRAINALFFWERQHCLRAYRSEVERRQLPSRYRSALSVSQDRKFLFLTP